jgi:plastocyanin
VDRASYAKEESIRVIRILSVLAIAATFGVAAGCDDDDDEDTAATEATTTEAAAGGGVGATEVSMTEYAFEHENLTVSRGDTITFTNDGEEPHNYTIPDVKDVGDITTGDVDPGSSTELTVDLDPGNRPGPFGVVCTIPGHAAQGMEGSLTVKP